MLLLLWSGGGFEDLVLLCACSLFVPVLLRGVLKFGSGVACNNHVSLTAKGEYVTWHWCVFVLQ